MRPCCCGGSNENCCWCFGSGYIREGQGAHEGQGGWHFALKRGSSPSLLSRSGRVRKSCPVCGAFVAKLQKHLNKVHNRSTAPAVQQNAPVESPLTQVQRPTGAVAEEPTRKRPGLQSCPLCNALVREDRFQTHISSRCPSRTTKAVGPLPAPTTQIKHTDWGKMQQFGALKVRDHLGKGGRWRWRKTYAPTTTRALEPYRPGVPPTDKTSHQAKSPTMESLRYKEGAEIEPPPWSNNLDATKNIGYPVRESGRYGSHPSHDAFDDESEP